MKRFVPKYLDPASRLGEILFDLISQRMARTAPIPFATADKKSW
jgi:hypothetical protein